jgi:hypothetical protein
VTGTFEFDAASIVATDHDAPHRPYAIMARAADGSTLLLPMSEHQAQRLISMLTDLTGHPLKELVTR